MLQKRHIIGAVPVAVSMLALTGFTFGTSIHSRVAVNAHANEMSTGQKVLRCLDQRAEDGYFNRNLTRAQRRTIQLNFRLCVRRAVLGHNGSSSSHSMSSSSSSSNASQSSMSSSSSSSSTSSGGSQSSNSSISSSSSSSSNPSSVSSQSSSSSSQTAHVTIEDFAFSPSTIVVKKGTTVHWMNEDNAPHTVTADTAGGPNSGQMNHDQEYSFTFNDTGNYKYHCSFHPDMKGRVVVIN